MAARTKKATQVTYLPPVNPQMQAMGTEALVAHGELGHEQSVEAGLEMLRRKGNTLRRKRAAEAQAA